MSNPTFGLIITPVNTEPMPSIGSDMAVIGLVGTAPDADVDDFPINTPVQVFSDDIIKLTALGTTGTLPGAIAGVNDQLGELQVAAKIVVVRVAAGVDDDATITNILGSSLQKTGIWALPEAGPLLGIIPRLIAVPGYTYQHDTDDGVASVTRAAKSGGNTGGGSMTLASPAYGGAVKHGIYLVRAVGGAFAGTSAAKSGGNTGNGTLGSLTTAGVAVQTGIYRARCYVAAVNGGSFVVEDPDGNTLGIAVVGSPFTSSEIGFTIADGATDFVVGDGFDITVVNSIPANGGVFSVVDPDGIRLADATVGVAYTGDHIKFTIADGAPDFIVGDGFDVTAVITSGTSLANPVVAGLDPVLDRLMGVAVVTGPVTSLEAWQNWRETISSKRIIPQAISAKIGVGAVVTDAAPRILGIGASIDHQNRGIPSKSWANRAMQGIVGPNRTLGFSLTDGATEGQQILSQNGGVILRGEAGVETAISSGGFMYVGTDTASDDPLWQFYNEVRMRDYIHLQFLKTLRTYLGKFNITLRTIEAVLQTMDSILRDLQAGEHILGYTVGFKRDQNSPENLRLGRFTVAFQAEEAPVLRQLEITSGRYRPAIDALLDNLAAQLNIAA